MAINLADESEWKGKSFSEFKFNVDRNCKVRVTLKANFANEWCENFKLDTHGYYNTNVGASVYPNRNANGKWDGTGWFEKDLEAGLDYYVLSKDDGADFTIVNVEYLQ